MARIPTASRWFCEVASEGSLNRRLTSAEDNEKALLLGYPPIGLVDQGSFLHHPVQRRLHARMPGNAYRLANSRRCTSCHFPGRVESTRFHMAADGSFVGTRRAISSF